MNCYYFDNKNMDGDIVNDKGKILVHKRIAAIGASEQAARDICETMEVYVDPKGNNASKAVLGTLSGDWEMYACHALSADWN